MKIMHEISKTPSDLSPFVESIWTVSAEGDPGEISPLNSCLPIGSWEMIFQMTPNGLSLLIDEREVWAPDALALATNGAPVYWRVKSGAKIMGIVLLPETMEMLTGKPAILRTSRLEALSAFESGVFAPVLAAARENFTHEGVKALVVDILRNRFSNIENTRPASYFREAMTLIRKTLNADHIEREVFVGKRQLQRVFHEKVGYGPKAYSKMLRFLEAMHFLHHNPRARLTDVAHDYGYADQSHFIREFKSFTGKNPRRFFASLPPDLRYSHYRA